MDLTDTVKFRFVVPTMRLPKPLDTPFGWSRTYWRMLERINTVVDAPPPVQSELKRLAALPRMSTLAVAAVIQRAVARMPADAAYLNIGVWNGFSLFAGMACNADKHCIGVDNFSEFGGPREAFVARFERYRSERHRFYEMDYEVFFKSKLDMPIGVYMYDGDHAYQHQLRALELVEPHLVSGGLIFVDDTNLPDPHRATCDFIASRQGDFECINRFSTAHNGHPTYWNGLTIVRKR